jgi:signal transduction histidine kinase
MAPELAEVEEPRTAHREDVATILRDLWPTFEFIAAGDAMSIRFESTDGSDIASLRMPTIRCVRTMIERAVLNVFTNALKYSYKPTPTSGDRFIVVRASPRYDTRGSMFSVSISNYGVPFESVEEVRQATQFGFRGRAAQAERPIGSGVGLFEASRIMKYHGGFVRIQTTPSKEPQMTVVWLVFHCPSRLEQ